MTPSPSQEAVGKLVKPHDYTRDQLLDLIGYPPEGSHCDEWLPRSATWHDERANWIAEVEKLRAAQPQEKLDPRSWLLQGGGGFEDGEDGLRACEYTGDGLIDKLEAYREYLFESRAAPASDELRRGKQPQEWTEEYVTKLLVLFTTTPGLIRVIVAAHNQSLKK